MSKNEGQFPHQNSPFAASELLAITSVISGYIAYLQASLPSPEGERRVAVLTTVRDQFYTQFASESSQVQVLLHAEEVAELLEVMIGFVEQIKRIFPRERDQAVSIINDWQLRLISIIAEHTSE